MTNDKPQKDLRFKKAAASQHLSRDENAMHLLRVSSSSTQLHCNSSSSASVANYCNPLPFTTLTNTKTSVLSIPLCVARQLKRTLSYPLRNEYRLFSLSTATFVYHHLLRQVSLFCPIIVFKCCYNGFSFA